MPCFYKKAYNERNQVYYPHAIVVGKTVETSEIAEALSLISTVSKSDLNAVLGDLAQVLYNFMSQGKSVHVDGLGHFRFAIASRGVASEAQFDGQKQIQSVRVRFTPERKESSSGAMTRGLVDSGKIEWVQLDGTAAATAETPTTETPTTPSGETGGETGGQDVNPLS